MEGVRAARRFATHASASWFECICPHGPMAEFSDNANAGTSQPCKRPAITQGLKSSTQFVAMRNMLEKRVCKARQELENHLAEDLLVHVDILSLTLSYQPLSSPLYGRS